MKISNFKDFKIIHKDTSKEAYTANVDVKTGFLLWKKYKTRKIARSLATSWFFVDTGKFVTWTINDLERSYKAKENDI
jgi:hypothetical protein